MAPNSSQVAAERAAGAGGGAAWQQNSAPRRVVFLNALPLNALPRSHLELDVLPVGNIHELSQWVKRRVAEGYQLIHYIRHPATIQALRDASVPLSEAPNSGLYVYQPGDVIVVVTLRAPTRGQEVSQVLPQDLESWIVTVL
jgi:hypothetical protein